MAIRPATKYVQDVITAIQRQFGDESQTQLKSSDIIRWINEGQMTLAVDTNYLRDTTTDVTVGGMGQYSFNTKQIIAIDSLNYDGAPLPNISFEEFQAKYLEQYSSTVSTTPVVWYEYAGKINLFPVPSASGAVLTLYFVAYPPAVSGTNELLSIPDSLYSALLKYCLEQAYILDDDLGSARAMKNERDEAVSDSNSTDTVNTGFMQVQMVENYF